MSKILTVQPIPHMSIKSILLSSNVMIIITTGLVLSNRVHIGTCVSNVPSFNPLLNVNCLLKMQLVPGQAINKIGEQTYHPQQSRQSGLLMYLNQYSALTKIANTPVKVDVLLGFSHLYPNQTEAI